VITHGDSVNLRYKWNANVPDFNMPVKVTTAQNQYGFIYPATDFQTTKLNLTDARDFKVAEELFFINVKAFMLYRE
jgi:hypothetical protein